jgi:predicted amidophosphoribosyltransferase
MAVTLYGLCPGCNNRFYQAGAPKCGTPVLTNCPNCKTPLAHSREHLADYCETCGFALRSLPQT